jgi:hypothetical protein
VLILVLLIAVAAVVAGGASVVLGSRHRRFDEVEGFHRARGITTGWSHQAMSRPVLLEQPEESEAESAR